jgi:DNA-binding Lrp family transcriptional regulator
MRATLHIARELRLPVEAASKTFAILAKRGAGKTYTAAVTVEEILKASLQVVVFSVGSRPGAPHLFPRPSAVAGHRKPAG